MCSGAFRNISSYSKSFNALSPRHSRLNCPCFSYKLNYKLSCILFLLERPKLLAAVGNNVTIGANDLLIPAVLSNVTAFSWYKDGQRITNQSSLYRIYSNNSLMIVKPSLALNGFYQMFYRNDAGFTVITQLVNVRQGIVTWHFSYACKSCNEYWIYWIYLCYWILHKWNGFCCDST